MLVGSIESFCSNGFESSWGTTMGSPIDQLRMDLFEVIFDPLPLGTVNHKPIIVLVEIYVGSTPHPAFQSPPG